ncbi:MAG: phosphomannomutase/phosphoglucomutase [Actinomycetota bacterium]|nr:phosphomannomutase/phosphoglucomutase [Actinomycetota bacterium]
MNVDTAIFKAYDIRGLYGEQMDDQVGYEIGRAFARVLGELREKPTDELRIGLGRDMRLQAPEMARRLRDGLVDEGAHVLDAGMIGTEMLYFLVGSRGLDGGAMVTASHNPKAYTGVKLVREGALALSGDAGIGEIEELIVGGLPEPRGGGSVEAIDVYEDFQAHALEIIDADSVRPLRVVADGGNGMAGPMVGPLLERLGLDLVETYWVPDGDFPDHEPNPLLPENRSFVIDRVLAEGADLGIAWDGDADRCFFIDETGEFVDGDFLTAMLASRVLAKRPGATILYDVRASRAVPDTVAELGGESFVNRVGHAFFKIGMREHEAAFGGEVSGHYYFRDFWCADSGTIPALLVLELLSVEGRPLSELVGEYRERYFISGEINSEVDDPEAKMQALADQHPDAEITRLDGVSVDYPDWHFNVRPSNTEPLLRLNLESLVSPEDMEEKRDEVLGFIRS